MAKKASKSDKILQNNLIHIARPTPLGLIHFFKINNIHIKEIFYPHAATPLPLAYPLSVTPSPLSTKSG